MTRATILLGGGGFIGRALHRRLALAGGRTTSFSSATLDLRRPGALHVLDPLVTPETDIVDLAAMTPDRGAVTRQGFLDNVAMAANLATYLEAHPVRMCMFVSSDVVYSGGSGDAVSEATPIEGLEERGRRTNLYAASKIAGERVLASVADDHGLPLLVVRPTAVFGPGDSHGAYGPNLFARTIARERTMRLFGQGEETRDHIYIDDLVEIMAGLLERKCTGVLNLATGTSRTFSSIVETLRAIVPFEFGVEHVPRRVPLTHRSFDVAKLKSALPTLRFRPFEESLRATFDGVS